MTTTDTAVSKLIINMLSQEEYDLIDNPSSEELYLTPGNSSDRNIGEIVQSTIPLNDSGLHLLDGSLIQGNGIYKGFVDYMANLYENDPLANFFTTEDEWQESLSNYGVCGKFVYDSEQNTVRLPKITGFIEGADNINNVCDLVEAGLPNIQGSVSGPSGVNKTGAFVGGNALVPLSAGNSSAIREGDLTFNASLSNSIYGNSETVQPQAIKVLYYIVVGTTVKNEIEVDIDNVASDLNNKMDKDLLNVTQDVKERVISWGMPDWSNLIATLTNNVTYTATVNCIVDGKIGCSRAANSNVKIFNEIGNLIKETTFGYSSADVNQYYFQFVIPQGYSIKINGTYLGSGEVHPLKGAN